jgi:hypothetical protein
MSLTSKTCSLQPTSKVFKGVIKGRGLEHYERDLVSVSSPAGKGSKGHDKPCPWLEARQSCDMKLLWEADLSMYVLGYKVLKLWKKQC